jgi:hypothetical protein
MPEELVPATAYTSSRPPGGALRDGGCAGARARDLADSSLARGTWRRPLRRLLVYGGWPVGHAGL